ncbi:MAG: hypothetical protein C0602_00590 [Denitrovibrio sp.]|nr:MAG: hypothetical protein C0602_00590 [Denitrovibrio sp.]
MIFGCTSAQTGATGDYSIYHSGKEFSKAAFGAKVFNSESEYESFLMGRSIKKNSLLNNLNFEKHSLVVAYLGKRAEDGYGLKILNVTVNTDKVMVTAKVVQADEKNAPHQFIVIEKTDKKAELRLE